MALGQELKTTKTRQLKSKISLKSKPRTELFHGHQWTDSKVCTARESTQKQPAQYERESSPGADTTCLQDFSTAMVIKALRYWQRKRQTDQWDRTDSPEIDLHKYRQLILDEEQRKHDE